MKMMAINVRKEQHFSALLLSSYSGDANEGKITITMI